MSVNARGNQALDEPLRIQRAAGAGDGGDDLHNLALYTSTLVPSQVRANFESSPDGKSRLDWRLVGSWAEPESNRRHMDFQSIALPAELSARIPAHSRRGRTFCKRGFGAEVRRNHCGGSMRIVSSRP